MAVFTEGSHKVVSAHTLTVYGVHTFTVSLTVIAMKPDWFL